MKKILFVILMILYVTPSWATFHYTHTVSGDISGGAFPSPGGDALLLESGDYLLLESGDKLLLE